MYLSFHVFLYGQPDHHQCVVSVLSAVHWFPKYVNETRVHKEKHNMDYKHYDAEMLGKPMHFVASCVNPAQRFTLILTV